jgi:FAD/FMN-containing dehydrogenase
MVPDEAFLPVDEAPCLPRGAGAAEAYVAPGSVDEVSRVLGWASSHRVAVVPVGTGAHLPLRTAPERYVVLSAERMAGIEIYEPADLTLTAGAGTRLGSLADALTPHDQWLPFDPPDVTRRTLGGLVATRASGLLGTGYGALRNHVLGATAVLGDGRVLRLGGRVVKNVAGFDLLRPLIGSQGSLAVLTSVCVRLFPRPQTERLLVQRSADPLRLVHVARAVAKAPVVPASVAVAHGMASEPESMLVVRLHGASQAVEADTGTLQRAAGGGLQILEGEEASRVVQELRDHPDGGRSEGPGGLGRANCLPTRLHDALTAIAGTIGPARWTADAYGGEVRFAFDEEAVDTMPDLRVALEAMGGSLGLERAPAGVRLDATRVCTAMRPAEAALAERVRAVFDPAGVFWAEDRHTAVPVSVGA